MATIADKYFRGRMLKGEIGLEIEVEGTRIPTEVIPIRGETASPFWSREMDGSLRGESAEYVLQGPVTREEVGEALEELNQTFKKNKTRFIDSGRAGVHVHINVRDMTEVQVLNFVMLYFVFEKALVRFCGEGREGNLFCLRSHDAEYVLYLLRKAVLDDDLAVLNTDDIRYSSINLNALFKYGSVEFRAMKSPVETSHIEDWVHLLLRIKDAAALSESPVDLVNGVSAVGGREYAESIFKRDLELLRSDSWDKEVYEGIRHVQPAARAYASMLIFKAKERELWEEHKEKFLKSVHQLDKTELAALNKKLSRRQRSVGVNTFRVA